MNPALVIIPTYNERDNLEPISSAVLAAEPRADILVVDDNSPDGTGPLADALAAKEPRIRVLHRQKKEGLGRAYLHAFQWALDAGYTFIIEMDADFSHDPKYLPRLIDEAMAGADLVLGSRYVKGGGTLNWGTGRQIISKGAANVLNQTVQHGAVSITTHRARTKRQLFKQSVDCVEVAVQLKRQRKKRHHAGAQVRHKMLIGSFCGDQNDRQLREGDVGAQAVEHLAHQL